MDIFIVISIFVCVFNTPKIIQHSLGKREVSLIDFFAWAGALTATIFYYGQKL